MTVETIELGFDLENKNIKYEVSGKLFVLNMEHDVGYVWELNLLTGRIELDVQINLYFIFSLS